MMSNQSNINMLEAVNQLRYFLSTAHLNWAVNQTLKRFQLPNGETISCVYWKNTFYITGTDIVRSLVFRFHAYGRPVKNIKKFEEGIFSDLRNLKPGVDAVLEEPRSEFLEMLYKNNCIRTQKKQKVFFWFSVPHDRLFLDALERDHKRESEGKEPSTVALQSAPLLEAMAMNPQTKIPDSLKQYTASSNNTLPTQQNVNANNNNYYINTNEKSQLQSINTNINVSQDKTVNMNYPMLQTQVVQMVQPSVYQQQVYAPVQTNNTQYVITQPQTQVMTPNSAVPVEQITTPTMNNTQLVQVVSNNQQVIYQQQPTQIITTQVAPITTYAQEGLGQSEIKNGELVNVATPTMINAPIVYTTVSPTAQSSPVSLDEEEIVFGEEDDKEDYKYVCDVKGCGRKFKRAENLRRHQRCHKGDSGYGKEMLHRQASVSKIQTQYVIKTQGPYTQQNVSYNPTTGIVTPISANPATQMPSPPTSDISYVVKQDLSNVIKPVSPSETYVSPVSQQTSPIIVTTAGAIYTNDIAVTSSGQTVNGSILFPSIDENQTTYVQTSAIVPNDSTSVCQIPSPPLQFQPNYTEVTYQTQNQPVYTTVTPIY
ncbi:STE like transcription factor-domain-containing protein [Neocallimastix lanati (nom. inval.)]|nr:STE like transcription factor-domain-containing protein [Neocallimastix sp. JGI-2020a]